MTKDEFFNLLPDEKWVNRFITKIKFDGHPKGCWTWTRGVDKDGYAIFQYKNGPKKAHRMSYMNTIGPIPDGYCMDHLCRTRNCVRPDHLEPVTNADNVYRGVSCQAINKRKSHCKNGHLFSQDNLDTYQLSINKRQCKICYLAYKSIWQKKRLLKKQSSKFQEILVCLERILIIYRCIGLDGWKLLGFEHQFDKS